MPQLTSELMVRLIDGVTGPARAAGRALSGLTNAAGKADYTGIGTRLAAGAADATKRLDTVRGQLFDVIAVGYMVKTALQAPVMAAARFETALEDIGQKAGIPTEQLAALGRQLQQVAQDTNQSASAIASSFDALVGMGAQADVALAASGIIGQAATAYRAATDDLAKASFSAVDNLKVPTAEIGLAIDMMAAAGKQGAFELRDMAQYFPQLGASYQALGQQGVGAVGDLAAALQVVRKGTGDSASAATNLNNVLQKLNSPQTIKAFEKMGVDLRVEMAKLAKEGMTPIEALAEVTNKALKGNLANLGFLFQDAQVQAGLRPLIQNLDEYRRIRDETMKGEGTVQADFERRVQTAAGMMARWQATIENVSLAIGQALIPALIGVADKIIPVVNAVREFAETNPQLTAALALTTGGLVAFRLAAVSLQFLGLWGKAGALTMLSGAFLAVGKAATAAKGAIALQTALAAGANYSSWAKLGDAFVAIARVTPGLSLVGPALGVISGALAAISLPVVAGIAAVAAAGALIWKYWDRLSSIFSGVASVVGELLAPAIESMRPALEWMQPVVDGLAAGWQGISDAAGAVAGWFGSIFSQEKLSEEEKAGMAQAGADAARAIVDAIAGAFAGLGGMIHSAIFAVDYAALGAQMIADLWAGVQSAFGAFGAWVQQQLANFFKFPWDGPARPASGPGADHGKLTGPNVPKYAAGGPMRTGQSVIVGDGGEPELFTAGADGYVTPFSQLKPWAGEGGGASSSTRGGITYAPQFTIGRVNGVEDLEGVLANFEARIKRDFDQLMAGTFSDPGVA